MLYENFGRNDFHMNAATVGKASLVLGVLLVAMSIVRRFFGGKFKREKKEKSSTNILYTVNDGIDDSLNSQVFLDKPSIPSEVPPGAESPSQNSDGSTDEESTCDNTVRRNNSQPLSPAEDHYQKLNKKLSSSYRKLRKRDIRRKRKQNEVIWMQREIEELGRLCSIYRQQCQAMDRDLDDKQLQLEAIFSTISMETEEEIKKKDPISFRKYKNLKSAEEAKTLMETLQNKQRALKDLELLSYKKYLSLSIKTDHKEKNNNRFLPVIPYKRNFDNIFKAIRTRVSVADTAKEEEADVEEDETSQNLQNVIVGNATARFREMREVVVSTEDENQGGLVTQMATVQALSTEL